VQLGSTDSQPFEQPVAVDEDRVPAGRRGREAELEQVVLVGVTQPHRPVVHVDDDVGPVGVQVQRFGGMLGLLPDREDGAQPGAEQFRGGHDELTRVAVAPGQDGRAVLLDQRRGA
jgi:hypothetical protein